ncbi:MAG: pilus assembly protein PilM [Actinobacteria bacterium]|nr:pilus assembly protein PilM [Actinomycetota bacterium]
MVDLKKEIKLSDLFKRPAKAKAPGTRSFPVLSGKPSRRSKSRTIVGLKIGASQLVAARVVNNGTAELVQLARQVVPTGSVYSGEVRNGTALAATLDDFFRENDLPRRGVRLGVATNRIGVRAFDLAGIEDDRQLANAIRFRAQEAVSIPIDEAVLDYHIVSETVDDAGGINRRVVLAVAYREAIDLYTEACRQAEVELMGIDLEAFALLRAVTPPTDGDEPRAAAVIALTIGHDRSTLAISDGAVCDFTRVLEWGGSNLVAEIERKLGVPRADAAELLGDLSLHTDAAAEAGADRRPALARDAVRQRLQTLGRELISSLQAYQSQPGSLAIDDVLLSGGTSRLAGFPEELARVTGVRVRRADPLVNVKVAESLETPEDLSPYAVAIGLGLEV